MGEFQRRQGRDEGSAGFDGFGITIAEHEIVFIIINMKIDKTQLLFGIDDPGFYYCTLWMYTCHHSELAIRIMSTRSDTPDTKEFYLIFTGVIYHEGPSKWQGVDFSIEHSERDVFLKKIINPAVGDADVLIKNDFYKLFKFSDTASGLEVKILASAVIRVENLP